MNAKLILLSICSFMLLQTTFQMPRNFKNFDGFDRDSRPRISSPNLREVANEPLNENYQDGEFDDDDGDNNEDEQALHEFISHLKKKGDTPSSGVTTWKPNLESNGLWDFKSFLNELVAQSQKKNELPQMRKMRMPGN